jgi:C_GCAxxG_C_C family probable redox protein
MNEIAINQELVERARNMAEEYFRSGGYFCSEAIVATINELLGSPFHPDVVRLASGFPIGIGKSGCVCGAVSGGIMALGMRYGRTAPGTAMPASFPAAAALHDYIVDQYGTTCCRVITSDFPEFNSPERKAHCIHITGEVAAWVMEYFRQHPQEA